MEKTAIVEVFAISLILSMISVPAVQAYHVSVNWGSTYHVTTWDPDPNWFANYEQPAQQGTVSYIANLYKGPNWVSANNYGSSTKSSYVYQCSDAVQSMGIYDYLATFHVGDMYLTFKPYGHWEVEQVWNEELQEFDYWWYWILDGYERHYAYYSSFGTYEGIEDLYLFGHTGWKHRFTFIYTCVNGGLIDTNNDGYYDCYGYVSQVGTGIIGMPFAWTQRTDLSWYGYSNPDYSGYGYIGFENISKWMCDSSEFYTHNYGEFVRQFYYYTIGCHWPVNSALDQAMRDMTNWSQNFGQSAVYNGYWAYDPAHDIWAWSMMRVFGDGSMVLPY
jgi:hypothetical protein